MSPRPAKKTSSTPTRIQTRRRPRTRALENEFRAVLSEGGLIPPEILARIAVRNPDVPGLKDDDFELFPGERLNERIADVWAKLKTAWSLFQKRRSELPSDDYGTTLTRQAWLIPLMKALDFAAPTPRKEPIVIGDKSYRLSHELPKEQRLALHLVSFRQDLDRSDSTSRAGAKKSPHSFMQEFLNQDDDFLWGVVSNGLKFRFLRDNATMSRPAFLEFDLETIMNSDAYDEFFLFYLVAHRTRFVKSSTVEENDEAPESDDGEGEEESAPAGADEEILIECWRRLSLASGTRALDELASDFQIAINALGKGFLERAENREIKDKLDSGALSTQDFYRQLLRLVYRIVFVLVAEERDLFFTPTTSKETKAIYTKFYSVSRLRTLSRRIRGGRATDLWRQLRLTLGKCRDGEARLGIPAFGSSLFVPEFIPDLEGCELGDAALLAAIRALTHTTRNNVLQRVDYRNLGAEELGSVYESLLEMRPVLSASGSFSLEIVAGNDRKTSGSYYTPDELVASLLDTALDPTVDDALAALPKDAPRADRENAILNLKICDPACGSGHFLVGAARRLGRRLAQIRVGEEEPSPRAVRDAVRDVVARSIYGVDLNPMAVELCKISLWLESMEPGKSLVFLDHRIKCGNSLIGATPELLKEGIPDAAFERVEGDDKTVCSTLKKKNAEMRKRARKDAISGQTNFLGGSFNEVYRSAADLLAEKWRELDSRENASPQDYEESERFYQTLRENPVFMNQRFLADLWLAAFVKPKNVVYGEMNILYDVFEDACRASDARQAFTSFQRDAIQKLADEYRFFHWNVEFPDVFKLDGKGGFDVVLGNPPWERVKLQEKEWFAQRAPEIADAANKAAREKLINALAKDETSPLYAEFKAAKRRAECVSSILRKSGLFPLCGCGDVNTYAVFAELTTRLVAPKGRCGFIVPSEIASGNTTKAFVQNLVERAVLLSIYDFENRKKLFPAVDSRMKFSLVTLGGADQTSRDGAALSFFNHSVAELKESAAEKSFTLTKDELALLNPNTLTFPILRSKRDAELTKAIYRRVPILFREKNERQEESNPWGVSFSAMFHMSGDSHLFRTRDELESQGYTLRGARFYRESDQSEYWPLYEAKMVHHYNHRFGDYADLPEGSKSTQLPNVPVERLKDKNYCVTPRYWVPKDEVVQRVPSDVKFLIGFRDISNITNMRTVIAGLLPVSGVGHTLNLVYFKFQNFSIILPYSDFVSFIHDYVARQKVSGTHMTKFGFLQLATLQPERYQGVFPFAFNQSINPYSLQSPQPSNSQTFVDFILPRVLELTYTSEDMRSFAESVGYDGEPFLWDEERRFLLRCELDALYFGLYLGFDQWRDASEAPESPEARAKLLDYFPTPLDALDYVMTTFPIVAREELADQELVARADALLRDHNAARGERFPSHAVIRTIFQEMTRSIQTGTPWRSWLEPLDA